MLNHNLLLTCLLSLLISVYFLQPSQAKMINHPCGPSSCGLITNISHPFRLKDDPKHCGVPIYELACENNTSLIYLNSKKYRVQAINYHNTTIRLADVSIQSSGCSFPQHSLYEYNFDAHHPYSYRHSYPYSTRNPNNSNQISFTDVAWPITFMSCQHLLKNSSLFTETTHCDPASSSSGRHTYVRVGHLKVSNVEDMCRVDVIVMTSWRFRDYSNISLLEIHEALLYGFELSWYAMKCSKCKITSNCYLNAKSDKVMCRHYLCPTYFSKRNFNCDHIGWLFDTFHWAIWILQLIFGVSIAARIIIGIPCMLGLLIYKFQRRHLWMFDEIEGFLESQNNLMPIRYSYSNIKKMTRGFQEKLGEGGFGSVYKGKLRSGHSVAVKVLNKSRADGQDFINEVATIGRIHHINVVRLVGYCAERSKCALIYDLMPNGSLDKYIFGQEKMNSLSWEKKYEIAIGVARGIGYLHRGCDIQILHFDIKPHNILLDDNFIPKISDFGLAKSFSTENNTVTLTAARGTIGYVAPELINRGFGRVSYKADVYSFGMLLMEMIGLKTDLTAHDENSSQYFPYWIYDHLNEDEDIEIGNIADENDNDVNDQTRKFSRKMTIVALWCIQMSPDDRPPMNKVVEMLEGENLLQIPPRPSQSPFLAGTKDHTWSASCSTDTVSSLYHKANITQDL